MGSTIIAMAQNRDGASLVGIDANKVAMLTFAISGALAAVAATLYAPINLVYPGMGDLVITKAFVIIILGGMGSVPGAIVGGLIIGFAESFGAFYVSTDYKDIIAFVLLVVILSIRPQGIFTKAGAVMMKFIAFFDGKAGWTLLFLIGLAFRSSPRTTIS
jgi:branched-chain amino acid transport system permease protein